MSNLLCRSHKAFLSLAATLYKRKVCQENMSGVLSFYKLLIVK